VQGGRREVPFGRYRSSIECSLLLLSDLYCVHRAKLHQRAECISNRTIFAVLNVVRPLTSPSPFLEALGGDSQKGGRRPGVENRIIIER
jgi:hypothetical protein